MHEHRACQPTPSNHHSHARSVHLATTKPNEPQPRSICHEATETSSKAAPAPPDAKANKQGTNRIDIVGTSRHALGEPTKPLRTRGAQARPWTWGSAPTTNEVAADEGHHTMPPGAPTTTLAQAREASERPRAWGSVPTTLAQQLMRWPQTRGHHAMPPGAPTATLAQRAVQWKLRNIREHGAQSPPTSLGASRHVRGTPTTTLALRLTSCAAHKRSFGTPMAMELSPLRKGLTPCLVKPMHQHARVRMLCAAGLSGHND